ncbi:MAG: hypothetical protein IJZ54_00280 [Clostridia bacterium]|nr:hypothetical protein [Clostridia bacterium]
MKSVFEMEKDELIILLNKDIAEIKGEFHYNEDFKEECEADLYRFEKEKIEKQKNNTDTKDFYLDIVCSLENWIAWYCLC